MYRIKRAMGILTAAVLTLSAANALAADGQLAAGYDAPLTADEVKEMYESRMLLSNQDYCSDLLKVKVWNRNDPLNTDYKTVGEYIVPQQAIVYAKTRFDGEEDTVTYIINAWENEDDLESEYNIIYMEIPAEALDGKEANAQAQMMRYSVHINWDGSRSAQCEAIGIDSLLLSEMDYEETAAKINKCSPKNVTAVFHDGSHGLMVTSDGIDYMIIEQEQYPPYDTLYGLVTPEEAEEAINTYMGAKTNENDDFLEKKRALTPNLEEVERDNIPVEPTDVLGEYEGCEPMFSDLSGDAHLIASTALLKDRGIISGYGDGTFRPESTITRAEAAVIISKLVRGDFGEYASFPDTENHWAREQIGYLTAANVIHGCDDGTFKPEKDITYEEAVTLILAVLGNLDPAAGTSVAKTAIERAMDDKSYADIFNGIDSFTSDAPITRGDFAKLTANAFDIKLLVWRVLFDSSIPSYRNARDITLADYLGGNELVNGSLFYSTEAFNAYCDEYQDEFYKLYNDILPEEFKEENRK